MMLTYVGFIRRNKKPRGRHQRYDGKVNGDDLTRFELAEEMAGIKLYTAVVNSAHFKRELRIGYLLKRVGNRVQTALLFSTDLELAAKDLYRFYQARFQIEFRFRDAKQFTGLTDCQARCRQAWHYSHLESPKSGSVPKVMVIK